MKRFYILIPALLLIMVFSFVSCNNNGMSNVSKANASPSFDLFEKALKTAKLNFSKKDIDAYSFGALEGYQYKLDTGNIDLFIFDNSEDDNIKFKEIVRNNEMKFDGFGSLPAYINSNMVLIMDGDLTNQDRIIEIFNGINF